MLFSEISVYGDFGVYVVAGCSDYYVIITEHYVIMCLTRQVTDIIQFLVLLKFGVLSVTEIITVAHTIVTKEEPVKKILPSYNNKGRILRNPFNLFSSSSN